MTRRRQQRGFTLIELLVAVFIFLIFISAVFGAYRAANQSMTQTEEQADLYQTGRVLLAQINAEITSAYQPATSLTSELVGEDSDGSSEDLQHDQLSLLTTRQSMDGDRNTSDVRRVTYLMGGTDTDETPGLYLEENRHPGLEMTDEEPTHRLLSPLVVGINYKYLPSGAEDWATEWVDQTTLPVAVRIELTLQSTRPGAKPVVLVSTANIAMATVPTTTGGDDAQP